MSDKFISVKIKKLIKEILKITKDDWRHDHLLLGESDSAKLAEILIELTDVPLFINKGPGCSFNGAMKTWEKWFPYYYAFVPTKNISKVTPGYNLFSKFKIPYSFQLPDSFNADEVRLDKTSRFFGELTHHVAFSLHEANMITSAQLDIWSNILCKNFGSDKPFSNLRMVFVGDPFQLKPILNKEESIKLHKHYISPLFFNSKAYQKLRPLYLEVEAEITESNKAYHKALTSIRNNKDLTKVASQLNLRVRSREAGGDKVIDIVSSNSLAEQVNRLYLDRIEEDCLSIVSYLKGDFKFDSSMPSHVLNIKIGARVIFIENDTKGGFKYGELGSVIFIKNETINILKDDGQTVNLKRFEWTQHKSVEFGYGRIKYEEVGSMKQFPIQLGYAISFHKSVGLQFDKIFIPNYHKLYKGQLYLALTRCKSLEGVSLYKKVSKTDLHVDERVVKYCQEQRNTQYIEGLLEQLLNWVKVNGAIQMPSELVPEA